MRFVIIFLLIVNILFAQLPEFFHLRGYRNLNFGMSEEEAGNRITNYNLDLYADFYETIYLDENVLLNIYKNDNDKLAYYLYFYKNYLYRIEICNHIGYSYDNIRFYYPVEGAVIDDIRESIKGRYGNISKTDVKYYSYYRKPFEEYVLWWQSDLASVSLYVKPDLDTLDRVIKKYSYRISFYDEIKMKEMRYSKR